MNYYIITGTSRGLGHSLAEKLIGEGNTLFCISRNPNKELLEISLHRNSHLHYNQFDLNHVNDIEMLMEKIFYDIDLSLADGIYLINNAGIVNPIKTIENCKSHEIIKNINVNLTAPMILTSEFVKKVTDLPIRKRVINVSSGAGKNPYHGWSSYCSSKAGLDMFTRTVALEQESKIFPVEILAISPGILNTQMQKEIRETDEDNFKDVNDFIHYKENGMLLEPEIVADEIIYLLEKEEFPQGSVMHVRDLLNEKE